MEIPLQTLKIDEKSNEIVIFENKIAVFEKLFALLAVIFARP